VWKAYREQTEVELIDLDEADGWIHLVNVCERSRGKVVVVNTAARNNLAVKKYGQTLDTSLEELGSRLVARWVINRQRDSVGILKQFMEAARARRGARGAQRYFGEEKKFLLYNTSKMREAVEGRGGKSITLPDLADAVTDDIYVKRLSLSAAAKSLPIGNRAELARWRGEVRKVLAEVVE
jgi:hypothetical protein